MYVETFSFFTHFGVETILERVIVVSVAVWVTLLVIYILLGFYARFYAARYLRWPRWASMMFGLGGIITGVWSFLDDFSHRSMMGENSRDWKYDTNPNHRYITWRELAGKAPRNALQENLLTLLVMVSTSVQIFGGYVIYWLIAEQGSARLGLFGALCSAFVIFAAGVLFANLIIVYKRIKDPRMDEMLVLNRDYWGDIFLIELILMHVLSLPAYVYRRKHVL